VAGPGALPDALQYGYGTRWLHPAISTFPDSVSQLLSSFALMRQSAPRRSSILTTPHGKSSPAPTEPLHSAFLAILVAVPVVFNAVWLWPELLAGAPTRSDSAFHLLMINGASDALARGQNPLDFWIPQLELGFPQFLYYQHFPHLVVVAVHRLLFGAVALETIYHVSRYLLLLAFPLTVYWSMRRLGFRQAAAAFGAAASSLISADARYGFEYNSYVWRGFGLYAQLWGMHLTFVALACLHFALRNGRGYAAAVASLAALALSHLVLAYMMSITGVMVLVALSDRRMLWSQLTRFVAVGLSAVVVASYMIVPFVFSSRKFLSGQPEIGGPGTNSPAELLVWLISGNLFDRGRVPVLSVLVAVGVVVAATRYQRQENRVHRLALVGLLVWLFLYVGHPTIGFLARLFPAHDGYVTSRFISTVDVFAILMIGVAGEWLWEALVRLRSRAGAQARHHCRVRAGPLLQVLTLLGILTPAFVERARYYAGNRALMAQTREALAANAEIRALFEAVAQQSGGRVYAGLRSNWGAQMRISPSLTVADYGRFIGLAQVGGAHQSLSLNAGLLEDFREGDQTLFDLLDVRWVVTPASATVPDFYLPFHRTRTYALHRVRTSGIAQYVGIHERRTVSTQRELYEGNRAWFGNVAMNVRQFIRWDYMRTPGSFEHTEPCADGGTMSGEVLSAGRVHLEAQCGSASTMLLKMTYHPNWKVTVDGRPAETFMVSPSFIGFDLPPGRHVVNAAYVSTPLKLPLALAGVAVLVLWVLFRKRLPAVLSTAYG